MKNSSIHQLPLTTFDVYAAGLHSQRKKKRMQLNTRNRFFAMLVIVFFWVSILYTGRSHAVVVTNPVSDVLSKLQHMASYAQQADALAKQALQYQNQILQYQAMLKNLQNNPLGVVVPNLGLLVTNTAKIMANGAEIGNNMSKVSDNIAKAFKNPQGDFGVKFRVWTNASTDALKGAMLNAGLHRENFESDTAALQALVTKNTASDGALAATKTLGEINTAQLMESIKLREMISSQQLAVNTYMMSESSKQQAAIDNDKEIQKGFNDVIVPIPDLDTSRKIYKKNNLHSK